MVPVWYRCLRQTAASEVSATAASLARRYPQRHEDPSPDQPLPRKTGSVVVVQIRDDGRGLVDHALVDGGLPPDVAEGVQVEADAFAGIEGGGHFACQHVLAVGPEDPGVGLFVE